MLKHYLVTTLRILNKNKFVAFVNLIGLTIGISSSILVFLWIQYEISFDQFHDKAENIYRVTNKWPDGGYGKSCPGSAQREFIDKYPEILNASRYANIGEQKVSWEETHLNGNVSHVDSNFFSIFTFPIIDGKRTGFFTDPNSAVITQEFASKFFKKENPIGKTIILVDGLYQFTVTAILKDIPVNSHIQTDIFIPARIGPDDLDMWDNNWPHIYVELDQQADPQIIQSKIADIVQQHIPDATNKLGLQQLKRIHLFNINGGGLITYIYIFTVVALFILIIACFNFINLSTAASTNRFKEIGIKKVIGAKRNQLFSQIIIETFLLAFLSTLIACIFVEIVRPYFNYMLNTEIQIIYNYIFLLLLIGIILIISVLAGLYPAIFFTSHREINILKNEFVLQKKSASGISFRNMLIVIQFVFAFCSISGILVISKQVKYIQDKELGFTKENVITIPFERSLINDYQILKNKLYTNPNILGVTASTTHPVIQDGNTCKVGFDGMDENKNYDTKFKGVDYDFIKTLCIPMVEGRFFSKEFSADDNRAYVVNEKLIEEMGMSDPIGKEMKLLFSGNREFPGKIIGVFKNYHDQSLYEELQTLTFYISSWYDYATIRINAKNREETLKYIEKSFKEIVPSYLFSYQFLEQDIDSQYKQELITKKILNISSFIIILLSCLGLLGLSIFNVEKKRKEIVIRKVNGATSYTIFKLLIKEYFGWIVIAFVIATPISIYILNKWLNEFVFKTSISIFDFTIAGFIILVIALITVFYTTYKVSVQNPVNNLRYE